MAERFGKDAVWDGAPRGENFSLALLAGVVAAGVAAVIWMQLALAMNLQSGWQAILVGVLVGMAVRFAGNGRGMIFGMVGGLLTLGACFAGDILTEIQLGVTPQHDFYASLISADIGRLFSTVTGNMSEHPISYLALGIGAVVGYILSIRGG